MSYVSTKKEPMLRIFIAASVHYPYHSKNCYKLQGGGI